MQRLLVRIPVVVIFCFVMYNCYSCISISLKNRIKRGERQSPVAAIDTWKISPSCKRKLYVFCSAFHQKLTQTHNSNQSVIPFTSYVLKGMKTRCPVVKFTCFCHHGTAFSSDLSDILNIIFCKCGQKLMVKELR